MGIVVTLAQVGPARPPTATVVGGLVGEGNRPSRDKGDRIQVYPPRSRTGIHGAADGTISVYSPKGSS